MYYILAGWIEAKERDNNESKAKYSARKGKRHKAIQTGKVKVQTIKTFLQEYLWKILVNFVRGKNGTELLRRAVSTRLSASMVTRYTARQKYATRENFKSLNVAAPFKLALFSTRLPLLIFSLTWHNIIPFRIMIRASVADLQCQLIAIIGFRFYLLKKHETQYWNVCNCIYAEYIESEVHKNSVTQPFRFINFRSHLNSNFPEKCVAWKKRDWRDIFRLIFVHCGGKTSYFFVIVSIWLRWLSYKWQICVVTVFLPLHVSTLQTKHKSPKSTLDVQHIAVMDVFTFEGMCIKVNPIRLIGEISLWVCVCLFFPCFFCCCFVLLCK